MPAYLQSVTFRRTANLLAMGMWTEIIVSSSTRKDYATRSANSFHTKHGDRTAGTELPLSDFEIIKV